MTKTLLTFCAVAVLWPSLSMAQGMDAGAAAAEARMNRDGYPYTVLSRGPILPPEEKRKIRKYVAEQEQRRRAFEADKVRQFRGMSADERRYVIETQGFPAGAVPGYRQPY